LAEKKKKKKKGKPKRKKIVPIKTLRNKLDKEFNAYIRERDKVCFLSGVSENLQCSHYYDKKASPFLRWDERNAHAMSSATHFRHHHGKAADYSLKMFLTYGIEYMVKLHEDAEKFYEPDRGEIIRLILYYQGKRRELK